MKLISSWSRLKPDVRQYELLTSSACFSRSGVVLADIWLPVHPSAGFWGLPNRRQMGTALFSQCLSQLKQNVRTEFSHKPLGKLCHVALLLNKIGLDLNYSGLCVKNGGYATERGGGGSDRHDLVQSASLLDLESLTCPSNDKLW